MCGLGAGALPLSSPAEHARLGLIAVYSGLTLMLLGWWWYSRGDGGTRNAYVTLTLWTAPLLLAPPMFSRDVYSYLAQGLMIDAGVDVYQNGQRCSAGWSRRKCRRSGSTLTQPVQAGVPGGPECDAVVDTHLVAGVLAMRLVAVAGLTLLAAAVPVLARSTGIRPATALWLAALNPSVLIHLVGGAHNDALTVGLLAAGLAAAGAAPAGGRDAAGGRCGTGQGAGRARPVRGSYEHESFDFLGSGRPRLAVNGRTGQWFTNFTPAISASAKKRIGQQIRSWRLHRRSELTLQDLAEKINSVVRGWINYYGRFRPSELRRLFERIDEYLVRWAMRKYKRLRRARSRTRQILADIATRAPRLFVHLHMIGPPKA